MNRSLKNSLVIGFCYFSAFLALGILIVLLQHVFVQGWFYLDAQLLNNFPSRFVAKAGLKSALFGSLFVIILMLIWVIPIGVACAIYLEEYASKKGLWVNFLRLNISNLAGLPSIVYGLVGLSLFVHFLGFGRSILTASLTLGLLVLPMVVLTAMGALRDVPQAIREAAFALGAQKWQVVIFQVLPAAIGGILTGIILALSRAFGESAPVLVVGAVAFSAFVPQSIWDQFSVLPIQIYNWASRPQEAFHYKAAAGIIVLLTLLLIMNLVSIALRRYFEKKVKG